MADIFMPGCGGVGSLGLDGDPAAVHHPADPYDPAQAKKLLAEAGYANGFSGGKFYPYGGYWESQTLPLRGASPLGPLSLLGTPVGVCR